MLASCCAHLKSKLHRISPLESFTRSPVQACLRGEKSQHSHMIAVCIQLTQARAALLLQSISATQRGSVCLQCHSITIYATGAKPSHLQNCKATSAATPPRSTIYNSSSGMPLLSAPSTTEESPAHRGALCRRCSSSGRGRLMDAAGAAAATTGCGGCASYTCSRRNEFL